MDHGQELTRRLRQAVQVATAVSRFIPAPGSVVNGLVSALLIVQLGIMLGWTVPSTFLAKRMYLRWLAKSKLMRRLVEWLPLAEVIVAVYTARAAWQSLKLRGAAYPSADDEVLALRKRLKDQSAAYRGAAALALSAFLLRAYRLFDGNTQMYMALDEAAETRDILRFKPPSSGVLDMVVSMYRSVCRPVFLGLENIPAQRPLLFVSNHTIMGLEFPLVLSELYKRKGIFLRALADHSHFQIPVNGAVLRTMLGAVDGTHTNADLLMKSGQCILVYPGGARETFKRTTDEKYALFWENRVGFAKLAIRHGCSIVPIVNLGTEDMTEVIYDLPLGWVPIPFLFRSDRTIPVLKPPTLSKLQRVYFCVCEPIHTTQYLQDVSDDNCLEVQSLAKQSVLDGLEFLKAVRQCDPERYTYSKKGGGPMHELQSWIADKAREQKAVTHQHHGKSSKL